MTRPGVDVAIIGAGPYGLSIAAHLRERKVAFRIFGTPMSSWRNHMAVGTLLKSFGFASNLYDPRSTFTLAHFCQEQGLPYSDVVEPVSLETFIAYGMEFQRRFIPDLEQTDITSLRRSPEGFTLMTQTGEAVFARRVIIAVGITNFGNIPSIFADLPEELVTHSSQHRDVHKFSNRTVAVIGAGASAADLAGLLHEAGSHVHMIARRDSIHFHAPPEPDPRPIFHRLLMPRSGLGQGWPARLCTSLPLVFHALPRKLRFRALQRINGPAPGWFAKSKVVGHVTMHLGATLKGVSKNENGVHLLFNQRDGLAKDLHVDHVIAATGYKVNLQRLDFLDQDLRRQMASVDETPILNTNFESSVPGLYLVGLAAASSFGPLCRFAYGAKFTADRIARHLVSTTC
jgi:cation diffusion facilitator CzcD-associated flavoprotein CzcO